MFTFIRDVLHMPSKQALMIVYLLNTITTTTTTTTLFDNKDITSMK